ncbi:acyl-CoA mutase large subunit family protein [bacterium]|nr:acyl-CoA mutase large subunit family protein [bacterium]
MPAPENPASDHLLAEFPVPTLAEWRAEVDRLLKGVPFAKAMVTRTLEGIAIDPMPTAADTENLGWLDSRPGQAPYVRGGRAGGYHEAPWWIAQELGLCDPADVNAALRHDLGRGQTAVNLVLDRAGMLGGDPVTASAGDVGSGGTSIADLVDLTLALEGVDLSRTPILIDGGAGAVPLAAMLVQLARTRGIDPARLEGCLGCDPVFGLVREGSLPQPAAVLYDQLADLARWAGARAPRLRTLPVHETPWHEGGADDALSLGLCLAGAVHVLREMEPRELDLAAAVGRIHFQVSLGGDFFMGIAKLRALRLLWSRIQEAAGLAPVPAFIHARTSRRTLAAVDPHVNMLRTTIGAMAAVLGGADSLHTSPFDEPLGRSDAFSRRIARNVQLILRHECHLDQVADPAGGSWYPEKLTGDLATAAWGHFQGVEAGGGILALLEGGQIQHRVAAAALARAERLATRRDVMIGVNQYAIAGEVLGNGEPSRPEGFAERRAREVAGRRGNAPAETGFAAMIEGAAAGATIAQLLPGSSPEGAVMPIPLRRDAEPFERLRRRVADLGGGSGTTVFCACLGDYARYMPRLDFVRRFFQVGGFKVKADAFFADPMAAAEAAAGSATVVVIVGLDETYRLQAAETARVLKAQESPPRVILAGQPGDLESELKEAGVDEFIHLRSDVLAVLDRLAADQEVES